MKSRNGFSSILSRTGRKKMFSPLHKSPQRMQNDARQHDDSDEDEETEEMFDEAKSPLIKPEGSSSFELNQHKIAGYSDLRASTSSETISPGKQTLQSEHEIDGGGIRINSSNANHDNSNNEKFALMTSSFGNTSKKYDKLNGVEIKRKIRGGDSTHYTPSISASNAKANAFHKLVRRRFGLTRLSWTILAFAALNVIFLGGKRRAFGIFIAEFHKGEFNSTSLAELNWVGDSYAAVGYLCTTLATSLILWADRRYSLFQFIGAMFILAACISSSYVPNPHWLFLTHTVLHGIGSSMILSAVGLIVNEYFDKNHRYHILATTLVSGGSVASIVFVEFYAMLIEYHGWRHAFLILGLIYFLVNVSACFVFIPRRFMLSPSAAAETFHDSSSSLSSSSHPSSIPVSSNATNSHKSTNHSSNADAIDSLKRMPDENGNSHFSLSSSASSPPSKSPNTLTNLRRQITRKHVPLLVFWTFDRVMTSIVTYGLLYNLADYLHRRNPSLIKSTTLTILFAAGEASTYLIGAILTAFTKNLLQNRLKYVLLLFTFFMAGCLVIWEFAATISASVSTTIAPLSPAFMFNLTNSSSASSSTNRIMSSNGETVMSMPSSVSLSNVLAYLSGFFLGPSITFLFPAGEEMTRLPGQFAYPFSLAGMGLGMSLSPTLSAIIATAFEYRWFFLVQGGLIYIKFVCLLVIVIVQHIYWKDEAVTMQIEEQEIETRNNGGENGGDDILREVSEDENEHENEHKNSVKSREERKLVEANMSNFCLDEDSDREVFVKN